MECEGIAVSEHEEKPEGSTGAVVYSCSLGGKIYEVIGADVRRMQVSEIAKKLNDLTALKTLLAEARAAIPKHPHDAVVQAGDLCDRIDAALEES